MRRLYYRIKPFIPRRMQILARRCLVMLIRRMHADTWPIDEKAGAPPANWMGWPEGKRFALVLTHDVDTVAGQEKCRLLAELEQSLGFHSSFNFVIENRVSPGLRSDLSTKGFEVGVHGLTHDGSLYASRETFLRQARVINRHLAEWNCAGFRSPAMHHNLEWLRDLEIEYDASTFDTDPFEPQPDGMGTIFPLWIEGNASGRGYVELPYTLPQDFTLFIIMKEKNIDIWKRKLEWIAEKGGMVLLNTHPDYMRFDGGRPGPEEYPASLYADLLTHIRTGYEGTYWHRLPRQMARFWRDMRPSQPRNAGQRTTWPNNANIGR